MKRKFIDSNYLFYVACKVSVLTGEMIKSEVDKSLNNILKEHLYTLK